MSIWLPQSPPEAEVLMSWARERLPIEYGAAAPVGICRDEALVAVCIYYDLRGDTDVRVSFVADTPRWATRQTIRYLICHAFWNLPVRRLTAIAEKRNARSRKLIEGVGFKREGTMRDAFPDDDAVIYGMTRHWWAGSRWFLENPAERKAA